MPSRAMDQKEFSGCPDGLRATGFPDEIFQHNTENRSGWTEEEPNGGFILLYFKCVAKVFRLHRNTQTTALNLPDCSELQMPCVQHQSENVLLFKYLRSTGPQPGVGSQGQVEGHFTSVSLSPHRHTRTHQALSPLARQGSSGSV